MTLRRALTSLALLGALLAEAPALAVELLLPGERVVTLQLTQTLFAEYHADLDPYEGNDGEKYFDVKNRTDLVLMHGRTTFNLRFDATGFVGTDDGTQHLSRYGLEKISLTTVQRTFEGTVGDFSIRIGRGLALDLTRVSELSRDTTLRGALLAIRTRYISGTLFGGWANPLEMDDLTEVPVSVPTDVIGGGRLEVRPSQAMVFGLHYAGGGMQQALPGTSRNATHTLGGSFEFPNLWSRVSLYGEFDYMSRAQEMTIVQGYGGYLSGAGTFGPVSVLVEFKYYNHLQFVNVFKGEASTFIYNRPPTLTRTRAEVTNNHDVMGGRLKLDFRIPRMNTLVYVNYGHFFLSDANAGEDFFQNGATTYDAYGGLQQPLPGGALDLSGGYRLDQRTKDGDQKITDYSQAFFEGELSMLVAPGHSIDVELQYHKTAKAAESYSTFYLGVGYRPSRYFSGGFSYEYSNLKSDPTGQGMEGVTARHHFGGVRATVNFTPSSFARLFGGTSAGGTRCIDGFCRDFPPFVGFRMELVVQL